MVYGLGMKIQGASYTHEGKSYFILKVREFANGFQCYCIDESGKFVIADVDEEEAEKIELLDTRTHVFKLDYVL